MPKMRPPGRRLLPQNPPADAIRWQPDAQSELHPAEASGATAFDSDQARWSRSPRRSTLASSTVAVVSARAAAATALFEPPASSSPAQTEWQSTSQEWDDPGTSQQRAGRQAMAISPDSGRRGAGLAAADDREVELVQGCSAVSRAASQASASRATKR